MSDAASVDEDPLKDPIAWIRQVMHELGEDRLVPSTERDLTSIWVDDDARIEAPGYYRRHRIPAVYRIEATRSPTEFALVFYLGNAQYRIACCAESLRIDNARRVAEVIGTVFQWVVDGIVTLDEGLRGFLTVGTDEWWRVLRLPPDATIYEIEEAFKRQALKVHPDRGGTDADFRRLRTAYERARTVFERPRQ